MDLSNELISQFAKITKDQNKTSTESIVYGTAVTQGGKLYVNIDGSDSITPVVTSSEIKAGERVTVMIKDHTATIMGNISNPSASTETVGKVLDEYDIIVAKIGNFELLVADKISTEQLEAKLAVINEALIGKATIAELEAVKATIKDLDVSNLYAELARIDEAIITKADIVDLDAVHAAIDFVEADIAEIETLIGGHLTMDNIQSLILTSSKVTVDNAFIKDAMIDRVSASKLDAGTVNTSLVNIASEDGAMTITGSLQQFKDADGNVRIQIGKDTSGDFTFALYGADGKGQLINQNGITASAISDGLIVNDMVAENAAIAGNKLDIDSVITEINGSTTTIKSSKIFLDDKEQTLEMAFSQLSTKVDMIGGMDGDLGAAVEQIATNTTKIGIMQGQVDTLISNTTVTKENGEVVQMKDDYSEFKQTVGGIQSKVGSLETKYSKTLKSTKAQYYVSSSPTELIGGLWSDDSPVWVTGKYIWQRLLYTYSDDSTTNSTPVCIQGAQGDKGEKGADGAPGEKGEKGDQGPQGEKGADGAPGEKGDQGPQGEKGADGAQGPQGEKGADGAPGEKGDKGDQGPQGEKGADGEQGPQGPQGEKGEQGEKGADGEQGPPGEKGDQGEQGADGQSVVSITPQFQAHTSNTTPPTGTWNDICPPYEEGKYLWIRHKVVFANPTETKYTDAYYDPSWDAKATADDAHNTVVSKVSEFTQTLDGFNTVVNEAIAYTDENGNTVYVKDRVTENSTKVDAVSTTVSSMESHFDEDGMVTNLTKQVSSLEQFASQFSMEFFQKIENADQGVNELLSYIHFDADGITIGQDHYPIRLMLTKDRIKFIDQNETQVAYFSEGKLYVNNAEILDTFKIGNYGFMSTANGSLTIGALS